jgi:hypothetical protein
MPFYNCFLCQQPFQFRPHAYDGRHVGSWDVEICSNCLKGSWDGNMPEQHPRLIEHLKARQIPIALNDMGLLNIPNA